MIVKMKKASIIVKSSWTDETLDILSRMGILHLAPYRPAKIETVKKLKEKITLIEKALLLIPETFKQKKEAFKQYKEDGLAIAKNLINCPEEITTLKADIKDLQMEYDRIRVWGNFRPEEIDKLNEKGINISLFQCREKQLKNISQDGSLHIIYRKGSEIFLAYVSKKDSQKPDLFEVKVPSRSLAEIKTLLKDKENQLSNAQQNLLKIYKKYPLLENTKNILHDLLNHEEAKQGMGEQGHVSYLTGFCPEYEIETLLKTCRENKWGILIEEPLDADYVPTLIQHSKFSKIIRPVIDFIGIIPGYREYDANILFLIFLSVFFAMLIGDGGYGLVMLVFTLCLKRFYKQISKEFTILMCIFSFTTMIWGAFTGLWFGMEEISLLPVFKSMIIPSLYIYAEQNNANIIRLCFLIGAVQLSVSHIWSATRIYPSLKAFSETGWAAIVWGIYFMAGFLVLNDKISFPGISLLFIGTIMIILFGEQKKEGVVNGILSGLARFPLNLLTGIGSFSDLISYIRLFAVGLATKEVAVAVNAMAKEFGFDNLLSFSTAILILVLGHSINLLFGAMAILVHGVRLNILECSKHLNIQWSGIAYNPFRRSEM